MVQIEGNNAEADDAIMLDKDGYVSETNATNIVSLCFSYSFLVETSIYWREFFMSQLIIWISIYECKKKFMIWTLWKPISKTSTMWIAMNFYHAIAVNISCKATVLPQAYRLGWPHRCNFFFLYFLSRIFFFYILNH